MPKFNYAGLKKTATSLINQFGVAVNCSRITKEYEPESGQETKTSELNFTINVVSLPVPNNRFSEMLKKDLKGVEVAFFLCEGIELILEDFFDFKGNRYQIKSLFPLSPEGSILMINKVYCVKVNKPE